MKKLVTLLMVALLAFFSLSAWGQVISTIAGNGTAGYGGNNGPAVNAELWNPNAIFVSNLGNIYIADKSNHVVRMINTSGIITTIAGNGTYGYSGDGGISTNAQLYNPTGVFIDNSNNLYIVDQNNQRIRKVIELPIGIKENKNNFLSIFPNPSDGVFNFESENIESFSNFEIRNIFGAVVYHSEKIPNSINLSSQSAGIYFYSVGSNKKERITGKLIKN